MFRKKQTWIILTVLFVISLGVAFNLFKTAFPILNIDLKMSRQDAFDKSTNFSTTIGIGPSEYSQAATFGSDYSTQTFIELDNGGAKAFIEMLDQDIYKAYTWKIRHYQENQVNEAWFTFSPEGELYGFYEKLSDHFITIIPFNFYQNFFTDTSFSHSWSSYWKTRNINK